MNKIKYIQFPITLEELDNYSYKKLYDNARNIYDRTRINTVNGKREEYKDVKCLIGDNTPEIRRNIWNNDRLKNEMRKAMMIFLYNHQSKKYTPEVHRITKNYDYNVKIMNKTEHAQEGASHMQGAMIMRDTSEKYEILGLEIFSSKRELAKRLGVNENLIYTCKSGQIIQVGDIVIQFQDVIKGEPKPITKDEVLEKLERYSNIIEKCEKAGLHEQREHAQKLYDIWRNTGESKGFFDGEATA